MTPLDASPRRVEGDPADTDADAPAPLRLRCAACGHPVTDAIHRREANGAHEHVVFNPAGMVFRIGCFRRAPGGVPMGEATGAFTWFPGTSWRLTLCRGCGGHLGWHYTGGGEGAFFGLILARLVEG